MSKDQQLQNALDRNQILEAKIRDLRYENAHLVRKAELIQGMHYDLLKMLCGLTKR